MRDEVRRAPARLAYLIWLLALAGSLCGCASHREYGPLRPFQFQEDTFTFANELVWEYFYDEQGRWTTRKRTPKPEYAQRCFVLARTARQFFLSARFDPNQPQVDEAAYRKLIRRVVATDPRSDLSGSARIVIPGYPHLRAFSAAKESLLKQECGGAWRSYLQRGNWRMIFPFGRRQQAQTATNFVARLRTRGPLIVHLLRFPQLTINHAVLIYDAQENCDTIDFTIYDPNQPGHPATLCFDRASRTFLLPRNAYFPGGRVDVYEVYHRWNY